MLGLLTGLIGDAIAPLIEQVSSLGARLLRKVALFLVAGLCLVVVLIALTIAFDLWIASMAGPIVGALAVAGLYLAVAVLAIIFALRDDRPKPTPAAARETDAPREAVRDKTFDARVDQFSAPLLAMLQQFGLKRELLAVLAGTSVAKRLGPLPLVGLAIVCGFLIGRMWKTWRNLISIDAILALVGAAGLFGDNPDDKADAAASDDVKPPP